MPGELELAVERLKKGLPPDNLEITREISIGQDFLLQFWREKYLENYLAQGGSKIKFLTGRTGSGRTHFLELLRGEAADLGYITVYISAREVWLHDFKEIYIAVLRQANLPERLRAISRQVISGLGFDPRTVPEDITLVDYLAAEGQLDALTKREIRQELAHLFLSNPRLDNNFALACSLLTGSILGYPSLEEPSRNLLMQWLESSREARLASVRRLGLSPSRITKYNARHMLRSLVEVCRLAGCKGLIIEIDDMEILAGKDDSAMRYTRMKREDAYESIRELIDEIDTLESTMFVLSFERRLMDEDQVGLKSYQALWMRVQNEIKSDRFNRFADIVDLDGLIDVVYSPAGIVEMSSRLAQVAGRLGQSITPLSLREAEELHARARFGKVSLPRRVILSTFYRGGEQI